MMGALTTFVLLGLACLLDTAEGTLKVDRLSFRLSYVADAEKLQRASAFAEGDEVYAVGAPDGIVAHPSDTIVAQVSCVDDNRDTVFPEQAMLRFVDTTSAYPQLDSIFPLTEKRFEMRKEISLAAEIRADREFWHADGVYRVELIIGDSRRPKGVVWTVCETFSFNPELGNAFAVKPRGVFDFDMSVKKSLLPEFITALPAPEKQAAPWIVNLFTCLSVLPLFCLLLIWSRMGVLRLQLPDSGKERICVLLFQLCLIGHVVILSMFWLKWNILLTWQAIGLNMVPTVYFGHQILSAKASRDYLLEKVNKKA